MGRIGESWGVASEWSEFRPHFTALLDWLVRETGAPSQVFVTVGTQLSQGIMEWALARRIEVHLVPADLENAAAGQLDMLVAFTAPSASALHTRLAQLGGVRVMEFSNTTP